jgi:hypothetical protein
MRRTTLERGIPNSDKASSRPEWPLKMLAWSGSEEGDLAAACWWSCCRAPGADQSHVVGEAGLSPTLRARIWNWTWKSAAVGDAAVLSHAWAKAGDTGTGGTLAKPVVRVHWGCTPVWSMWARESRAKASARQSGVAYLGRVES